MANEIIVNDKDGFYPAEISDKYPIEKMVKLPFTDLSVLGVSFDPIMTAFKRVFDGGSTTGLYKVSIPPGTHLAQFKGSSEYLGAALSDTNNQISAQARLNPVVCDPTTLFMAAALANIEKKLDAIQETTEDILEYLKQKEKAKIRGNMLFLDEIAKNFKFNWDNKTYKRSNHIKVLDIKQEAEQSILLCKSQIENTLKKRTFIHTDLDVKKKIESIRQELDDYQLSNYIYAMSSYLDVMLLDNRDPMFLDNVNKRIDDYYLEYRNLYSNCYSLFEHYSKTSIQSTMIKGIGRASGLAGKGIAKIPVISRSQIDENLIAAGDKLEVFGEGRADKRLSLLLDKQSSYVRPFIESINTIKNLYNNPLEIVFDKENIYLESV